MRLRLLLPSFLSLVPAVALAAPGAPNEPKGALPSLPGPTSAPASSASSAADPAPSPDTLRRGVVQVEQAGRPMAVGIVLSKDGRVVTSLSGLGGVELPEVRYADGTIAKAKVLHKDKVWDLALLVPQTGRWLDGLVPSDADPQGGELKSFLPKGGKLTPVPIFYKGRVDARAKEGEALRSALDVDLKGSPGVPGAPLIDGDGRVLGILVRLCKDNPAPAAPGAAAPCAPVTLGAPVYALRNFLVRTPADAAMPSPWLGLGGAPSNAGNVRGVRVVGVAPGSPAEKAGLKVVADSPEIIVAVDGQPVETPEQLADVVSKRAIGQTIKLLVFSAGKFRDVGVTLRSAP